MTSCGNSRLAAADLSSRRANPPPKTARSARAAFGATIARLTDSMLSGLERSAGRRRLHGLSDHMLKDLGVSRADVAGETGKRFWQE